MKVAFLWFGMFFYLLAVVVEEANRVDHALLETALTLGATALACAVADVPRLVPAVFGSFRILYDIGWTYVILAEMVNARKGVGYMVEAARKVLDFDRVYAGIIAIGIAAFLFRWLLTLLERWLFPWRRAGSRAAPAAAVAAAVAARCRNAVPTTASASLAHDDPLTIKISLQNVSRSFRLARRRDAFRRSATSTSKWRTYSLRTARTSASSACCWARPAAANPPILRLIAGLDRPDTGEVLVNGKPRHAARAATAAWCSRSTPRSPGSPSPETSNTG